MRLVQVISSHNFPANLIPIFDVKGPAPILNTSMALVPFSFASPFHDPMRLDKRIFSLCGRTIRMHQEVLQVIGQ